MLNGILNFRGLNGSIRRSAIKRDKDERITRCGAESVEIGEEIEPTFPVEEARIERSAMPG